LQLEKKEGTSTVSGSNFRAKRTHLSGKGLNCHRCQMVPKSAGIHETWAALGLVSTACADRYDELALLSQSRSRILCTGNILLAVIYATYLLTSCITCRHGSNKICSERGGSLSGLVISTMPACGRMKPCQQNTYCASWHPALHQGATMRRSNEETLSTTDIPRMPAPQ
jgi:hypothetical protein